MAQNEGKRFEDDFKKSCPDYALLFRIPDSAQSFGVSSKTRFSRKNPFDFILWDSSCHKLYALELKTVAGKTISFEREQADHGEIHLHQIDGLKEWNRYDGTVCGFIIYFRGIEKTIYIDIAEMEKLIAVLNKKSFGVFDLDANNIYYTVICQTKKRTRYRYDIDEFLNKQK